jgi:hypothetical protein
MIILASATDVLRLVTTVASVTLDVLTSWVDRTATDVMTPGSTPSAISGAATTTIAAAPSGSNVQRNVQTVLIKNRHATLSQTVTPQWYNGTVSIDVFSSITLAPGESLQFVDGRGWTVFAADGSEKIIFAGAGRYLGTTVLSAGTSFQTQALTQKIFARLLGAGGGGSGCTSVAAAAAAGGGGGGGSYAEKVFAVTPNTAYTYAIGAAGTGVSGAGGNNGGNTTFAVGATTVTAFGGQGAPVATAATTLTARAGGAGGAISTNGDLNTGGAPGEYGVVLIVATPIVASGNGGSSEFGGGGLGLVAAANGNNGIGFGAGGGGSATGASAVRTGGNGTAGVIIVDEYA